MALKKKPFLTDTDLYERLQALVLQLFPNQCLFDGDAWTVLVDARVPFKMTFSGNETKIWFDTFRVFAFEEAEKYLRYKKGECELINSIEG